MFLNINIWLKCCTLLNIIFVLMMSPWNENRISGVMVSVFASSAVDRGFESRSGKTKDY
jgi:hypothetical protein